MNVYFDQRWLPSNDIYSPFHVCNVVSYYLKPYIAVLQLLLVFVSDVLYLSNTMCGMIIH